MRSKSDPVVTCRIYNFVEYRCIMFERVMKGLYLTDLPLVPHICVNEWVGIGSDNGLPPTQPQAIS